MTVPRFENPPYYITAYGLAVKRGYKGTLDEWLSSLQGKPGDKVQLRRLDDKIQWRWIPAEADAEATGPWTDLVDTGDLAIGSNITVTDDDEGNVVINTSGNFAISGDLYDMYWDLQMSLEGAASEISRNTQELERVKSDISTVKQTSESVTIQLQSIVDDGVTKVTTATGYTFDAEGMHIDKSGEEMSSLLDHTGLLVSKDEDPVLEAKADGVNAKDVTIRNYLVVGGHARFEAYSDGTDDERTACFWI